MMELTTLQQEKEMEPELWQEKFEEYRKATMGLDFEMGSQVVTLLLLLVQE
jgi:hypothetical protein